MISPYPNPFLSGLEDLGAITSTGLYEIKPFKDWSNTLWKDKIFSMRLCNAGELVDILEHVSEYSTSARDFLTIHETLIRAIHAIDGMPLVTSEKLQEYNKHAGTNFTELSFLRSWIRNIEQPVLERLNAVYAALQTKQIRKVYGLNICAACETTFSEVPENSAILLYSVAEIVCNKCLPITELSNFDIAPNPSANVTLVKDDNNTTDIESNLPQDFVCTLCNTSFTSVEELSAHRENCENG